MHGCTADGPAIPEGQGTLGLPSGGLNPDAVGLLERFGDQMLATARLHSGCPHDAEDAYQRATEILLRRRPTGSDEDLRRWLRTTTKYEAIAIKRHHARVLASGHPTSLPEPRVPAPAAHEQAERLDRLRLGAQALKHLKPHELRCMLLKAEGYSYREICEQTGFSHTKVNRCLAEGRRRFLDRVAGIEAGEECGRLAPHLSALADGEADAADLAAVGPHLKTCLTCRARLREFRSVPAKVAALAAPAALAGEGGGAIRTAVESLLGVVQDKLAALGERAHAAVELAAGQKAVAVAASAAAIAGGGATVSQVAERDGVADAAVAKVARAGEVPEPAPAPVPPPAVPPSADPAPEVPTPAATPAPAPAPPAPSPAAEFAPEPVAAPPRPARRAAAGAQAPSPAPPTRAATQVLSDGAPAVRGTEEFSPYAVRVLTTPQAASSAQPGRVRRKTCVSPCLRVIRCASMYSSSAWA